MIIDERLERLVERHEALTRTVELIAIGQQKNDEQIRELSSAVQKLSSTVQKLTSVIETDAEIVRVLADVARNHERRLTHLEGGE